MTFRILALGDSYTAGEGVAPAESWPSRLLEALRARGLEVADLEVIARTGWTTSELAAAIEARQPRGSFDAVTLLIGVNNQYRGLPIEGYRREFAALLETVIGLAGGNAQRVIVISIPDWGATPFAVGRDRVAIAAEIDAFNAVNRELAGDAGARYVDVTAISREACDDTSLVAADGLHPSGAMYARWIELLAPVVGAVLEGASRGGRAAR